MRTYCVVFRSREIFRVEANGSEEAREKAGKYLNTAERDGSWEIEDIIDLTGAVPICPIHQKLMNQRKGEYGTFWSCGLKMDDGKYCSYRPPRQAA